MISTVSVSPRSLTWGAGVIATGHHETMTFLVPTALLLTKVPPQNHAGTLVQLMKNGRDWSGFGQQMTGCPLAQPIVWTSLRFFGMAVVTDDFHPWKFSHAVDNSLTEAGDLVGRNKETISVFRHGEAWPIRGSSAHVAGEGRSLSYDS